MPKHTPLEQETLHDTTTFEALGQEWTIPTKRNSAHFMWMQNELRLGVVSNGLMVAHAFLSPSVSKANQQKPDQFAAFMELEPTEDQLEAFADELGKALGVGDLKLLALVFVLLDHEDAVEGTFWRYGTDLADLYRDTLTLRQVWVRMKAMPYDSPLAAEPRAAEQEAEARTKVQTLDETMRLVDPNWKGA